MQEDISFLQSLVLLTIQLVSRRFCNSADSRPCNLHPVLVIEGSQERDCKSKGELIERSLRSNCQSIDTSLSYILSFRTSLQLSVLATITSAHLLIDPIPASRLL
jgi:hypothetical protein